MNSDKNLQDNENDKLLRATSTFTDAKKSYQGQLLGGKKDGKGTEINQTDKTQYVGYWQQNKFHGEGTFHQLNTGCYYKGTWEQNNKKHGFEIFPNGDQYQGDYKDNKFHGFGILHNKEIGYRYEGYFEKGNRHGQGKEFYKTMSFYEGNFKYNQKDGVGKLTFANGSYYEGRFVEGEAHGYGIHVAFNKEDSKSLIQQPIFSNNRVEIDPKLEIKNDQDLKKQEEEQIGVKKQKQQLDQEEQDEFFYEGDFVQGYKHGIGRYCEPDGSYFYCHWEFDKKIKHILYYDAQQHKSIIYEYKKSKNNNEQQQQNEIEDDYVSPYEIMDKINIVREEVPGFPPLKEDAYRSKIEECGISGDPFEDPYFLPSEESIQMSEEEMKDLNIPGVDFYRMTEHDLIKKNTLNQIFSKPFGPGQLMLNEYSDHQLISCLEALAYYPSLLQKIFTQKYEIDMVCFFTLCLYIDGNWKEIVVDDFIPCHKINKHPIFCNTINKDYGWYAIQKAICKHKSQYFYYSKKDFGKQALNYLQMLTGLPCKSLYWSQITDPNLFKTYEEKLIKKLTGEKYKSKTRIAYLRDKYYNQHQVIKNFAYNVIDCITLSEEIQGYSTALEFNFLIIFTVEPDFRLKNENEKVIYKNQKIMNTLEKYLNSSQESSDQVPQQQKEGPLSSNIQSAQSLQNEQAYQKNKNQQDMSKKFFIMGVKDFYQQFGEIHILQGPEFSIQNQQRIKQEIVDSNSTDFKLYIKFELTSPQKVSLNVLQHLYVHQNKKNRPRDILEIKNQEDYYPTRIVLGQVRDAQRFQKERIKNDLAKYRKQVIKEQEDLDFIKYKEIAEREQQKQSQVSPSIKSVEIDKSKEDMMDDYINDNQSPYTTNKQKTLSFKFDQIQENESQYVPQQQQNKEINLNSLQKLGTNVGDNNPSILKKKKLQPEIQQQNTDKKHVVFRGLNGSLPQQQEENDQSNKDTPQIQRRQEKKKSTALLMVQLPDNIMEQDVQRQFIKSEFEELKKIEQQKLKQLQREQEIVDNNVKRKKQMPYNYIFGKGQLTQQDTVKQLSLEMGTYILMIQTEGPAIDTEKQKSQKKSITRSFILDFTFQIFSDRLIKVQHINEPENFQKQIYEQCILQAERSQSGKSASYHLENFSKTDLTDREDGCNDLIITQYFLKSEGTFLQYLKNKSMDKKQKTWRQKLQFRNSNMRIITQGEEVPDQKIDVYLWPQQEQLIIIQQIGAKKYHLEGGEGICIIDNLKDNNDLQQEIRDYYEQSQMKEFGHFQKLLEQKHQLRQGKLYVSESKSSLSEDEKEEEKEEQKQQEQLLRKRSSIQDNISKRSSLDRQKSFQNKDTLRTRQISIKSQDHDVKSLKSQQSYKSQKSSVSKK